MKRLSIYMLAAGMAALSTSCSDFLDTVPKYSSPLNPKENFSNQLMANTIPQNSLLF